MPSALSPLCVLLFAWRAAASHPSHANRGYTVEHSGVYGCCTNRTLSVLMYRGGWQPLYTYDSDSATYQGYLVGLLDAVVSEMGATLQFVDIAESGAYWDQLAHGEAVANVFADHYSTFEQMTSLLEYGTLSHYYDYYSYSYSTYESELGVLGSDSIFFSPALTDARLSGLVYVTDKSTGRLFMFLQPFKDDLWLLIFGCFCVLCACSLALDLVTSGRARPVGQTVYEVAAILLGGGDSEWDAETGSTKILRLGLLFTMLIVQSTYTANLAAFFTNDSEQVSGPTDLTSLSLSTACISFGLDWGYGKAIAPYVHSYIYPDQFLGTTWNGNNMSTYGNYSFDPDFDWQYTARADWCAARLANGDADIWIDNEVRTQRRDRRPNRATSARLPPATTRAHLASRRAPPRLPTEHVPPRARSCGCKSI